MKIIIKYLIVISILPAISLQEHMALEFSAALIMVIHGKRSMMA